MTTTRRKIAAALAAAVTALSLPRAAEGAGEAWRLYVNARFGARVRYPQRFVMQPPPANDDGRTFLAADGARLLVFGRYNVQGDTLESLQQALSGPDYAVRTYQAGGARWFVVSGFRDVDGVKSIYYEKTILSRDGATIRQMALTYPERARAAYDGLVAQIAASFGPAD